MKRLGFSLYPEHSTPEKDKAYIDLCAKYGFKRIFTCLLSVNSPVDQIKAEFKDVISHAHKYNMEVFLDVAPNVFEHLGISYDNLAFFAEIGADGIRLDEGFDGAKEAMMTNNPYGLKIEINASLNNAYLDNVVSHYPNRTTLCTCHNFYPQRYSGLSLDLFNKTTNQMRKQHLRTAAFISSQTENRYGPWPVNEGLCTLEMHRDLPIDVQARHFIAMETIDDILIANAYASEAELASLSKLNLGKLAFDIAFEYEASEVENKILFEHYHFVRGDMSEYMARSTMPRVTYASEFVEPRNTRDLKRGDVVIVNSNYARYSGELQIILKDMPNDGRKNVIGHIPAHEAFLVDYLDSWRSFEFIKKVNK